MQKHKETGFRLRAAVYPMRRRKRATTKHTIYSNFASFVTKFGVYSTKEAAESKIDDFWAEVSSEGAAEVSVTGDHH